MRRPTDLRPAILAGVLALSGGLAGCSHTASLGHGAGAANQERQQAGPNAPTQTIDPRNASGNPAPPRTLPIQGSGSDPFATAPPGALPDPYANPPR